MAVIGRRAFVFGVVIAGSLIGPASLRADDAADVHKVIGDLAESLSSGEVTQAMAVFSKNCPNYAKLNEYFGALTDAYFVENRLEFLDEEVSSSAAAVAVRWDLALTTKQSGFTKNRSADLTVKLAREGKHWRMAEFGPILIFDPQAD